MGIDGIGRGTHNPLITTDQNQSGQRAQGLGGSEGTQQLDDETLFAALQKVSGSKGKTEESLGSLPPAPPPPPPGAPETTKTISNMNALSDSQVSADIYAFMALFQKLAQQMRDTARTQRTTEMQAQVTSLMNAAEKMKDAAASRFTAAVVQGAMQIASGAVQMGMSAASMSQTVKGARMEADGKNVLSDIKTASDKGVLGSNAQNTFTKAANNMVADGQSLGAKGQLLQSIGQSSGGILGGMGTIVSAGFTYQADMADADKAKLEAQAKVHETAVQHANDTMQQMMDIIRDVRDKLQAIQQSAVETNRGIARNI